GGVVAHATAQQDDRAARSAPVPTPVRASAGGGTGGGTGGGGGMWRWHVEVLRVWGGVLFPLQPFCPLVAPPGARWSVWLQPGHASLPWVRAQRLAAGESPIWSSRPVSYHSPPGEQTG